MNPWINLNQGKYPIISHHSAFHTTICILNLSHFWKVCIIFFLRLKELAIQLGYADSSSTFKSAVNAINDDKDLYFETEDEVINAYKQEVENIKPKLATVFETKILTEKLLNVDVKPTPPGTAGIAYYEAGTPDGRRDGVFYINR